MNDAEGYYNDAVKFYKSDYGDDYIRLNFAERKVPDEITEEIIQRIRILREKDVVQRSLGYFGLSLIFISFGITCLYFGLHLEHVHRNGRPYGLYYLPHLCIGLSFAFCLAGLFDIIEPKYFRRKSKKKY